jgi:hypothetical protein
MTDLPAYQPDEADERPALLKRIRPIAKVVFGVIVLSTIVSLAYALWDIADDVWNRISAR